LQDWSLSFELTHYSGRVLDVAANFPVIRSGGQRAQPEMIGRLD
jgi:hypothetical protein